MHDYIKQSNKLIWRRGLREDCVNEVTALWDEFIIIRRGNMWGGPCVSSIRIRKPFLLLENEVNYLINAYHSE